MTPEATLSDHQPANNFDLDSDAKKAPANNDCDASKEVATDLLEPDFSRLRMARATLDRAFREG